VFLKEKNRKSPSVIYVDKLALCISVPVMIAVVAVLAFNLYNSAYKFVGDMSYRQEVLKYNDLKTRLDSLENVVKLESKLVDKVSSLENDLSLAHGIAVVGEDVKKMGIGGRISFGERTTHLIGSVSENRILAVEETIAQNKRQFDFLKKRLESIKEVSEKQKSYFDEKPSILPASGRFTSEFGSRNHPVLGRMSYHEGLDIANLMWTPVVAPADGMCTYSGPRGDYGLMIEITHRNSGYTTRYAHLKSSSVKVGDIIKRGDMIGNVGNSGLSTGPHLHYEVRIAGTPVNPRLYIVNNNFDYIVD
jgi:murein DD-endopeptidase MepM/ murein hydrolase activator NlpD